MFSINTRINIRKNEGESPVISEDPEAERIRMLAKNENNIAKVKEDLAKPKSDPRKSRDFSREANSLCAPTLRPKSVIPRRDMMVEEATNRRIEDAASCATTSL
jgi:hypothetical protein